jgi:tetraacyldisaccharide 4'-kinase
MRAYAHSNTGRLVNYWYQPFSWDSQPNFIFFIFFRFFIVPFLIILSFLYQGVIKLRFYCYKLGIKKTEILNIPIIIIGNITVGGTGKTPLVVYISDYLIAQGLRPGIISRGYKASNNKFPQIVSSDSDPCLLGDEAVMLAKQTGCPIVVCRDRVAAVKKLLSQSDCNIIVSDDGLQHYALHRDIEIAVVDAQRVWGNGRCLPAGPLREPVSRLHTVDFICVQGKKEKNISQDFDFSRQAPNYMSYIPGDIYQIINRQVILDPASCVNYPIHAVAGIGNPNQFFALLRSQGLEIIEHAFPDHHAFTAQDIDFGFESLVIMTEKDAVKCRRFADDRHWCLPISLDMEPLFLENFQKRLDELV